ncbi:MAG: hypothetical protein IKE21_03075 [Erysipelotrichaceae bacterium]|nr:hypothetical protein [Erysipelotrichaceae bacterium]
MKRSFIGFFLLVLSWLLIRYPLFSLHGMKDWPLVLLAFGTVVIVTASFLKCRYVPLFTALGYLAGFLAGYVGQSDSYDPGGGRLNNLWWIWTLVFLTVIVIGIVVEILQKRKGNEADQ